MNLQQKCKICSTIRITETDGEKKLDNRYSEICVECEEWAKNKKNWEEELFELAEKYCQHNDTDEFNNCLYWIFRPVIIKALKAQRQELFSEINKWGRTMMDRKVPLKEMGEDPEDDGWYDYDELTSSIISHIRYDEKGNLKKEYE